MEKVLINDKSIEISNNLNKRKNMRCPITLPIEVKSKLVGKLTNISKYGGRLISKEPLISPYIFYINLPPCYSDNPNQATGIRIKGNLAWKYSTKQGKERFNYGFSFSEISVRDEKLLSDIIDYEVAKIAKKNYSELRPQINIHREIHSCNMYAIDLTVGCDHNCLYCHFALSRKDEWQKQYPLSKNFPISVDISPIYKMKTLPKGVVYLSPSSDPFGNSAKDLTYELLKFFLPQGVKFAISTKAIIPKETLELVKKYSSQIDLSVGITNLSQKRNNLIEDGCPSIDKRLEQLEHLSSMGYNSAVRMDPLFPLIDDNIDSLNSTIKTLSSLGVKYISTAYIFTFGRFLKSLKKQTFLKDSMSQLKEKCYVAGGQALSLPIAKKKETYDLINKLCEKYKIKFAVCGCKEVGLKNTTYSLICRRIMT